MYYISHEYKCIYIRSTRTASTSIIQTLGNLWSLGNDDDICLTNDGKKWFNESEKRRFNGHFTANQVKSIVKKNIWKNYFKFSSIRNPWDRIVSLYFWRIEKDPIFRTHIKSFDEFVLTNNFSNRGGPRLIDFCCDEKGKNLVDYCIRYEYLQKDFKKALKKFNYDFKGELIHSGSSEHEYYRNYYNSKTKDIIYDYYKKDIKLFKYEF